MGGAVASVLDLVGALPEKPDNSAQEEALRKQEERIKKQEQEIATNKSELAKKTQAKIIQRRDAGTRQLLSGERANAEAGVTSSETKLGANA
jgi:hypothetical protein